MHSPKSINQTKNGAFFHMLSHAWKEVWFSGCVEHKVLDQLEALVHVVQLQPDVVKPSAADVNMTTGQQFFSHM